MKNTPNADNLKYEHLRHKIKDGSFWFSVCGTISSGKTHLLNSLSDYVNNPKNEQVIKSRYPNIAPFCNKFKVFYEEPDPEILGRYYIGYLPRKITLYKIIIIIILSIVKSYLIKSYDLCNIYSKFLIPMFGTLGIYIIPILTAILIIYYIHKNQLNECDVSFDSQVHFLRNRKVVCREALNYNGLIGNDRSWEEDKLFPEMQKDNNQIYPYQYKIYKDFFYEYSLEMPLPNFYLFLDIKPETAYKNLQKRIYKRLQNDLNNNFKTDGIFKKIIKIIDKLFRFTKDKYSEDLIPLDYLNNLGKKYDDWKDYMKNRFGEKFIIVEYNEYQSLDYILKIIDESIKNYFV